MARRKALQFINSPKGQEYSNTRWPYNPRLPLPCGAFEEDQAQYARVVGCLITDSDHGGDALRAWRRARTGRRPGKPVPSHGNTPPRSIELLPNQPRSETLRGIAVVAAVGPFDAAEQEIDVRIAPPWAGTGLHLAIGSV